MPDDVRMRRGEFLTKGAVALGAAVAAPLVGAAGAQAAAERALAGVGGGELGLVGCDHVGLTVPDINQAIEWFEDVLGAVAPLTFGPFPAGAFVASVVDVAETTSIDQITMLRIGHSANIELFKYTAPDGQRHDMPKNSDWSGHHVAFYVTDIDTAVEYMVGRGVRKMPAGPFTLTRRTRGRTDDPVLPDAVGRLHRVHQLSGRDGVPGAEREAALVAEAEWDGLRRNKRARACSASTTSASPFRTSTWRRRGSSRTSASSTRSRSARSAIRSAHFMTDLVDVNPRAVVQQIRMLRGGNGPNIELFQYTSPDQDQTFRQELRLGRPPHRLLRSPHRQGGRVPADGNRNEAVRPGDADATAPRPASRSTTSKIRSEPTSS